MRKALAMLFVLFSLIAFAVTRDSLPKEVREFVEASSKLKHAKLKKAEVTNVENLSNGDRKTYYLLTFEKWVEDGKVTGRDGITITWQGGQTVRYHERVVLTVDKSGRLVQRTCWDSDNKMLSQTIFK